jgi:hypothetical protein
MQKYFLRKVSSPEKNRIFLFFYSVLKLLTGLATAALIAWKLIVSNVISREPKAVAAKIHHDIPELYA